MSKGISIEISNTFEKGVRLPRRKTLSFLRGLPFAKLAARALPKGYELSLVICGDALAQSMNKKYRKKSYRPNVLSFPLSKREGEIFLNVRKAAREARTIGVSATDRLARLFVHGCVHLAGHNHGKRMDLIETKILKSFGYSDIP